MAYLLRMPEVAANATEAVLADWVVAERAAFEAKDTLATVETEKAVVDVEAETAGVLLTRLADAGAHVTVGAPIALVGEPGEDVEDVDAEIARLGTDGPPAPAADPVTSSGGSSAPSPTPRPPHDGANGHPTRRPTAAQPTDQGARVFASPLARRLALEAGLDIAAIPGSGPRGRVLKRDVHRAATDEGVAGPAAAGPGPRAAAGTSMDTDAGSHAGGYVEIPHSTVRRLTAERLVDSVRSAPHFHVRATLRAERLLEARREVGEGSPVRVSLTDLLLKAAGAAQVAVPDMNVTWAPEAIRRHQVVDIALAVATDRGLLTPVVRGIERVGIRELAARTLDLVERARAGRIRQHELEGGTLTVSNLGMFGTQDFDAIINPPHAGILAVGAVREEPVVVDGRLEVGQVVHVSLSADHRAVDGAVAARWMSAFTDYVEHPIRMLA